MTTALMTTPHTATTTPLTACLMCGSDTSHLSSVCDGCHDHPDADDETLMTLQLVRLWEAA